MIRAEKEPVLLHIPKTGGTTLRNTLGLAMWYKRHRTIGEKRMQRVVNRLGENAHVFTFLRDPIDRAVSAYYFFKNSREMTDQPPKGFNSVKQKAWLFSVVAHCADMDANQFYRGLLKDGAFLYRRLCRVTPHFYPQAYWVEKAQQLSQPTHYYDFSRFGEEFNRLLADIGAKERPQLLHMMQARRPAWRDEMDGDVIQAIKTFYADDYKLLEREGITIES